MTNPFENIDARLSNIENLLHDLNKPDKEKIITASLSEFKYIPIQDIFKNKICSKATFYVRLKAGLFSLYKFGNKSFVEAVEFENAFRKVKLAGKF